MGGAWSSACAPGLASRWPEMTVSCLDGESRGLPGALPALSLVTLTFREFSVADKALWLAASETLGCPVWELAVNDSALFRTFPSLILSSLKKRHPQPRWPAVGVAFVKDQWPLRKALDIENILFGRVYLVKNGLVRWKGYGRPAEREIATLKRVVEEVKKTDHE
jgi:hypothetical protein